MKHLQWLLHLEHTRAIVLQKGKSFRNQGHRGPCCPLPPIKSSASYTYSRYVPPPKSKSYDNSDITSTKRKREVEPELGLSKKVKRMKEKRHEKSESIRKYPPRLCQTRGSWEEIIEIY
jgi:hypothetical protein